MAVSDGLRGSALVEYLEDDWPPINKVPNHQERVLYADVLRKVYHACNGDHELTHKIRPECASLSAKQLERKFGKGRFQKLRQIVGGVEVGDTWIKGHSTKAYWLSESMENVIRSYFKNSVAENKLLDMPGNLVYKAQMPDNAIVSRDKDGNPRKGGGYVPRPLRINDESLFQYRCYLRDLKDEFQADDIIPPESIVSRHNKADKVLQLARLEEFDRGVIPRTYREVKSGRVYGQGTNLQNATTDLRRVAFDGLGYVEYDISNCNFVLLRQMARREGLECPGIAEYIDQKDQIRLRLARDLFGQNVSKGGDAVDAIKKALLALIHCARRTTWGSAAIPRELTIRRDIDGVKKAQELYDHPDFQMIKKDVREAQQAALGANRKKSQRSGFVTNAMGKAISEREPRRKQIAHVLQGAEALILDEILVRWEGQILIPRHDGFIARSEVDVDKMEKIIKDKTGFSISMERERFYTKMTNIQEGLNTPPPGGKIPTNMCP